MVAFVAVVVSIGSFSIIDDVYMYIKYYTISDL